MTKGVIISVKGLVVQVQFDDDVPFAGELVIVENEYNTALLVHHLEIDGLAICLDVRTDHRIQKGMSATRTNKGIEIPVGDVTIGRIMDAFGEPLDGEPLVIDEGIPTRNISKFPTKQKYFTTQKPEILETGIKAIDFFTPLVKGHKIGIIGDTGVGKTALTMELMNNLARNRSSLSLFAGIGGRINENYESLSVLQESGLLKDICTFLASINENPIQRSLAAISSVALAEYFRDEQNKDILYFIDGMYSHIQACNEVSDVLGQVPNEGGYEPSIFSDIKVLQDRLSSNEKGSITSVQTVCSPAYSLFDPAVRMIRRELDSVLILSHKVADQGIYPAIDISSTSSPILTPEVVGERHHALSIRVQSLLQKHASLKNTVVIIGENELSASDRADYAKAEQLIQSFSQNMHTMTKYTGIPGDFFTREQTLQSIEKIIA